MKTKKLHKRLVLKKVTVTNLNDYELNSIRGGDNSEQTACAYCDTEGIACRPSAPCTGTLCYETGYTFCVCPSFPCP